MSRTLRSSLLAASAVLAALFGLAGHARAETTMELASSAAQRCLLPASDDRVKPVYPPKLYDARIGANIDAEFEFTAPDRPPTVHLDGEPREDFQAAIEAYAKQLRLPCMTATQGPVKLRQTFDFVPNDERKVVWTTPLDEANPARTAMLKCIVTPSPRSIEYPAAMVRQRREGIVNVRLRFFDPGKGPTVTILSNGGDPSFGNAMRGFFEDARMPCLSGEPVETDFRYTFRIEGGGNYKRHVLKDLPLQTFLSLVKAIKPGTAFYDTNTMKCPFDVRLTFRQPFEPNRLQELDEDVPARHAFLDWLGERQFDLDLEHSGELIGQQMTLHVPCVKVDL